MQRARDQPEEDRQAVEESIAEMAEALRALDKVGVFMLRGCGAVPCDIWHAQWHVCGAEHCVFKFVMFIHLGMALQERRQS